MKPTGLNQNWRKMKSALASALAFVSAVLVISPLGLVFFHLLKSGATSVNWDFFVQLPKPVGVIGGGMANAMEMGTGIASYYWTPFFALSITGLLIWTSYNLIARVFKWMTLVLS